MMLLIRRYWARSIVTAGEIEGRDDMGAGFTVLGLESSVPVVVPMWIPKSTVVKPILTRHLAPSSYNTSIVTPFNF